MATRRDILLKAADLIATDRYRQRYRAAVQSETAVVEYFAEYELNVSVVNLRHYATIASTLYGETFASIVPGGHVVAQRRAIGVMYSIMVSILLSTTNIGVTVWLYRRGMRRWC